MAPSFLYLD